MTSPPKTTFPRKRIRCEQTQPLANVLVLIAHCGDSVLLERTNNRALFFPSFKVDLREAPSDFVDAAVEWLLAPFAGELRLDSCRLVRVWRQPLLGRDSASITIQTYVLSLSRLSEQRPDGVRQTTRRWFICHEHDCEWNETIHSELLWTDCRSLESRRHELWGVEPLDFSVGRMPLRTNEPRVIHVSSEVLDDLFEHKMHFQPVACFVQNSTFDRDVVAALWNEWIHHVAPATTMTLASFKVFLNKVGVVPDPGLAEARQKFHDFARQLFGAFCKVHRLFEVCYEQKIKKVEAVEDFEICEFQFAKAETHIDFGELLVGLVLLDCASDPFRFWHIQMAFVLQTLFGTIDGISKDQVSKMLNIVVAKSTKEEKVQSEVSSKSEKSPPVDVTPLWRRLMRNSENKNSASFKDFQNLWKNRIRQIEEILISFAKIHLAANFSEEPIIDVIKKRFMAYDPSRNTLVSKAILSNFQIHDESNKFFEITTHKMQLNLIGQVNSISAERTQAPPLALKLWQYQKFFASSDCLDPVKCSDFIIRNDAFLLTLMLAVKDLVIGKEKLVRLPGPAMVVGEVGGSLPALIRLFWRLVPGTPHIFPHRMVVLGNYFSDKFEIETFVLLMLIKFIQPERIVLLRGVNDCRQFLEKTTLQAKFKDHFGENAYRLLLVILESLPLACVVDGNVFVSHSGIPQSSTESIYWIPSLKTTNRIEDFKSDNVFHELLFGSLQNRPTKEESKTEKKDEMNRDDTKSTLSVQSVLSCSDQSLKNERSKTSQKTTSQNAIPETAILDFLNRNCFSHFIRTDSEMIKEEFTIEADSRVITLGSLRTTDTSKDEKRQRAFALIEDDTLKLIRFNPSKTMTAEEILLYSK